MRPAAAGSAHCAPTARCRAGAIPAASLPLSPPGGLSPTAAGISLPSTAATPLRLPATATWFPPPPYGYPPQGYAYPGYPLASKTGSSPMIKRLSIFGSILVLICFFLPWITFPPIFQQSVQQGIGYLSDSELRENLGYIGFSAGEINSVISLKNALLNGNISALNLTEANGLAAPFLDPTTQKFNMAFGSSSNSYTRSTIDTLRTVSTVVTLLLIVPLAGIIGLLALTGTRWSRILAQVFAVLGLLYIAGVLIYVLTLPGANNEYFSVISLVGIGVWGSIVGLVWQFVTPFFVRD